MHSNSVVRDVLKSRLEFTQQPLILTLLTLLTLLTVLMVFSS